MLAVIVGIIVLDWSDVTVFALAILFAIYAGRITCAGQLEIPTQSYDMFGLGWVVRRGEGIAPEPGGVLSVG